MTYAEITELFLHPRISTIIFDVNLNFWCLVSLRPFAKGGYLITLLRWDPEPIERIFLVREGYEGRADFINAEKTHRCGVHIPELETANALLSRTATLIS
ncbi:MAG: hypothetical protein NTY30_00025 [Candidatus Berkelbacteria bacterium]|nr:hypothetical protein [Candidatus Berkelbacteria bacterium]